MRAIVVTGSRKLDDVLLVLDVLQETDPDLVIHGDARGADYTADQLARGKGIRSLPMPAQWDRHGSSAGPRRNAEMVNVAKALRECGWHVTCEAFPLPGSKGTRDCMDKMLAADFAVRVHERP